jgi:hypothetical protein
VYYLFDYNQVVSKPAESFFGFFDCVVVPRFLVNGTTKRLRFEALSR